MSSVKILHCADLHIGAAESSLGTLADSRRAETLITFENIVKLAKDSSVDILLIAGDLFNSNNIEDSFVTRVFECLSSIPDIKIVYAAGNHDPLNADSPFTKHTLPSNLYVLKTSDDCIEFSELNTRVYGKSFKETYMAGSESFSLSTDNSFINLMCIHGDLRSDLGSDYNSITSDFIKSSGMDYIALGHVHKRTDIGKIGDSFIAYCGCPEGQGFDELGEKGVYLGEVSMGDCKLDFVPVCKRMHLTENVDITDLATSNEIADKVLQFIKDKYPDSFADNLYKIILTGGIDDGIKLSLAEITTRVADSVYFVKLRDNTEFKIDYESLSKENTLKGIFVKKMLTKIESAESCEKAKLLYALNIGIKAFSGGVNYDET
ncbi:MAG: DNA repair exonuclease [Clostridia bacterium]|nr:DNA repair exonuclease [Clostridia bacterium]